MTAMSIFKRKCYYGKKSEQTAKAVKKSAVAAESAEPAESAERTEQKGLINKSSTEKIRTAFFLIRIFSVKAVVVFNPAFNFNFTENVFVLADDYFLDTCVNDKSFAH